MSARSEVDVVDLVPVDKVADALPYVAASGSTGGSGGQQAEDHVPLLEGYADALSMRCPARGRWSIVLTSACVVLWLKTIHDDYDT